MAQRKAVRWHIAVFLAPAVLVYTALMIVPLFGTLIGLFHRGKPVLGIIDQPILQERWLGVDGERSTLNGKPISTRACAGLANAYMYSTAPSMFAGGYAQPHQALTEKVKLFRWGGDCYAYGLLASGHVDLVVEADLKLYDYAALIPVITGAGGTIGADEYLFRLTSANRQSEDEMLRGRFGLTHRESEVLLWIAKGKANRDIGEILGLHPDHAGGAGLQGGHHRRFDGGHLRRAARAARD